MKLHFGHGVLFFGVLFAGFVIYLVVQMVTQRVDLVEKDYYERGLDYQSVIDDQKNERVGFSCKQSSDSLVLQKLVEAPVSSCVLELYRPSDSRLDTSIRIPVIGSSTVVELPRLEKGMWQYTLRYQEEGSWYYQKEVFHWK